VQAQNRIPKAQSKTSTWTDEKGGAETGHDHDGGITGLFTIQSFRQRKFTSTVAVAQEHRPQAGDQVVHLCCFTYTCGANFTDT
jgi:hypothetical protein